MLCYLQGDICWCKLLMVFLLFAQSLHPIQGKYNQCWQFHHFIISINCVFILHFSLSKWDEIFFPVIKQTLQINTGRPLVLTIFLMISFSHKNIQFMSIENPIYQLTWKCWIVFFSYKLAQHHYQHLTNTITSFSTKFLIFTWQIDWNMIWGILQGTPFSTGNSSTLPSFTHSWIFLCGGLYYIHCYCFANLLCWKLLFLSLKFFLCKSGWFIFYSLDLLFLSHCASMEVLKIWQSLQIGE